MYIKAEDEIYKLVITGNNKITTVYKVKKDAGLLSSNPTTYIPVALTGHLDDTITKTELNNNENNSNRAGASLSPAKAVKFDQEHQLDESILSELKQNSNQELENTEEHKLYQTPKIDLSEEFAHIKGRKITENDVLKYVKSLVNKAFPTKSEPLTIKINKNNLNHIVRSNLNLKDSQKIEHDTALIKLENIIKESRKTREAEVDLSHNKRQKTINYKSRLSKFIYFETPVIINGESFNVELATAKLKKGNPNESELYNIKIKKTNQPRPHREILANTLSIGLYDNNTINNSDVKNLVDEKDKTSNRRTESKNPASAPITSLYEDNNLNNPDVKKLYQEKENARGFFDFSNFTNQIIQILQKGETDTLLHELGHFFTVNYVRLAMQTENTYLLKPVMEHYNITNANQLISNVDIQEDLAENFLTYLKTNNADAKLYPFFAKIKSFLRQTWEYLKRKGLVKDNINPAVKDFFDRILNIRHSLPSLDIIKENEAEIKGLIESVRSKVNKSEIRLKGMTLTELENVIKSGSLTNDPNLITEILLNINALKSGADLVKDEIKVIKHKLSALKTNYQKAVREFSKESKQDLKNAIKTVVDFIKTVDLPADIKNFYYRKLNGVRSLKTALDMIKEIEVNAKKRHSKILYKQVKANIEKTLKSAFNGRTKKHKFDYTNNKYFKELKGLLLSKKDIKRFEFDAVSQKTDRTKFDDLKQMLLYFWLNPDTVSVSFQEKLNFELSAFLENARKAKDDLEIEKYFTKIEERRELLSAINQNKNPTSVMRFLNSAISNFSTSVSLFANQKLADEMDISASEIKSQVESDKRITSFLKENQKLLSANNKWDLLRIKNEWNETLDTSIWSEDGLEEGVRIWKSLTKGQLLYAFALYQNKDTQKSIDNWYSKEQIQGLFEKYLTENDRRFALNLIEYIQTNYDEVNKAHIDIYAMDLPQVDNYFPRRSEHTKEQDVMGSFAIPSTDPNFTKHRSKGAKPIFESDILSVWMNYEKDAQYLINQGREYKRLSELFRDPAVQTAIKEKWGNSSLSSFNKILEAMSLTGNRRIRSVVSNLFNKILGNVGLAKISFNPIVWFGQLTSFIAYSQKMPKASFWKDYAYGLLHPKKVSSFMKEYVGGFLNERWNGGFNEVLRVINAGEKRSITVAKLGEIGTSFVKHGDRSAIVFGGYPYLKHLLKKMDKKQAVDIFIRDTLRSQQSYTASSLSNLQRDDGVMKIFTMFKNTPIQFMRKIMEAVASLGRGEMTKGEAFKQIMMYGVKLNVLFILGKELGNFLLGFKDGDDIIEELPMNLLTGTIGSMFSVLPLLGDIFGWTATKVSEGKVRSDVRLLGISDIEKSASNILNGKLSTPIQIMDAITPFVEISTGLPVQTLKRGVRASGLDEKIMKETAARSKNAI